MTARWRTVLRSLGYLLVAVVVAGASVANPEKPKIAPGDWSAIGSATQPVDDRFSEHWAEAGVEPAPNAEDLVVARRLSLALVGSIPSLEELRWFEAQDPEQRVALYTDRLLADRRWADHLAERLARAYAPLGVEPFVIYRRRRFVSWLSDQLHAGRPYDGLVRELITAEGLWTDTPSVNFMTGNTSKDENEDSIVDPEKLTKRVARAFLGLHLDCAQCHDHPFGDWTQDEFRNLAAFFGETRFSLLGIQDDATEYALYSDPDVDTSVYEPAVPRRSELLPEKGTQRQRLAAWITHRENPTFAPAFVNRLWTIVFGRGLVEPVDDLERPAAVPGVLDLLATEFRESGYDVRHLTRCIVQSRPFQLASAFELECTPEQEAVFAAFPLDRLRSDQIAAATFQIGQLHTIDRESHWFLRLMEFGHQNDFQTIFGDAGAQELAERDGTIPQRLVLMNGKQVRERVKGEMLNATFRVSRLAPDDASAVEVAYLVCLSRRPTPEETDYFVEQLESTKDKGRDRVMADLFWALVNSAEFEWYR